MNSGHLVPEPVQLSTTAVLHTLFPTVGEVNIYTDASRFMMELSPINPPSVENIVSWKCI